MNGRNVIACSRLLNPAASANTLACCGVSERMGNIIIPCGSKILRSLLRRASIEILYFETFAQLLLCHCEERQRRGNLLYYQYAVRLLHFVRNDTEHIVQRFIY